MSFNSSKIHCFGKRTWITVSILWIRRDDCLWWTSSSQADPCFLLSLVTFSRASFTQSLQYLGRIVTVFVLVELFPLVLLQGWSEMIFNVFRRSADLHSQLQHCFLQETANCLPLASEGKEEHFDWIKENTSTELKLDLFFFKVSKYCFSATTRTTKTTITKPGIEERAKFALHIFKHCWSGSQPWMPIVAYALYMLYSKSIFAMSGQPEGKAWNFPLKQKKSHRSQAFCSQVKSFVSSFLCKADPASEQSYNTSVIVFKGLELVFNV